jgi:hypothetical protein
MYEGSWSTVKAQSAPASLSSYTEDTSMTAKPTNNPMQTIVVDDEIQINLGRSDRGYGTAPPGYTDQHSVSEPKAETLEKARENNDGRPVTFADPISIPMYRREYPFSSPGETRRGY